MTWESTVTFPEPTDRHTADAHDAAQYVLAHGLRWRAGDRNIQVKVTEVRPSRYVEIEHGYALWTDPTVRWYVIAPPEHEDCFAFEITTRMHTVQAHKIVPLGEREVSHALQQLASWCRGMGAKELKIDYARRVVTGTFSFRPDNPIVEHVRATGFYSAVDEYGRHARAEVPPYASRRA